jgi:hypothetical protein
MGAAETHIEPGIAGLDVLAARVDSESMEAFMGTCDGPRQASTRLDTRRRLRPS